MDIAYEAGLNFGEESVFFVEHEGIYSAGKSFKAEEFLTLPQLPIYFPNRGGKITVHSRGQIVIYPIINLRKRNLNISEFIGILEKWIIDTLLDFGVYANLSTDERGVWISDEKIGFIGVSVIKGVSKHGLCLNISNDLKYFNSIIPCGIKTAK
ncbi:MAG: lipoyl(octanoyl) transferase LipB, partial [Holosporales bacterium]|nr:lipoyl(octanoyl) transferase LipB [Holosporales bacterium]